MVENSAEAISSRSPSSSSCLGVFAKFWTPGRVKTRLARQLPVPAERASQAAAEAYRRWLHFLLLRVSSMAERSVLAFTPAAERERLAELTRQLPGPWQCVAQSEGDLGQRMETFFRQCHDSGTRHDRTARVVLIGSDSPTLPRPWISKAFEWLAEVPVVLGPSIDGGYYLIGLTPEAPRERLFRDMPWSSRGLLRETLQRLEQQGVPFRCLPRWYDVDELADLKRLRNELDAGCCESDAELQLAESLRAYLDELFFPEKPSVR